MKSAKPALLATVLACFLAAPVAAEPAMELELYVDVATKQIFAEPGPNRVSLGVFQRTGAAGAAPAVARATLPAPAGPAAVPAVASPAVTAAAVPAAAPGPAAAGAPATVAAATAPAPKKWFENLSIRGYTQFRYNEVFSGDEDIRLWIDSGVGEDRAITIRRARVILSGDIGDHLSLYLQPDFASSAGDTGNVAQLRDAYGDISFDAKKEFRLRIGQSKVPYSFENLQSSQNRLALDRNDALNSCCRDERDFGAFFYWAPAEKRALFRELVSSGLKGSGDYGILGFGFYNGQGANRTEQNNNMHMVARATWPHRFENGQIFEAGVQAIRGRFVPSVVASNDLPGLDPADYRGVEFDDERVGMHAVWYPQPFGLQAEWNWGTGPQLAASLDAIEQRSLQGGYIQAMYKDDDFFGLGTLVPFVKWQRFDGALKFQPNAPFTDVSDWEIGFEWQPVPQVELVTVYHRMDRNDTTRAPYEQFRSDVLRVQVQINY
jgi:phosphate-selective porin